LRGFKLLLWVYFGFLFVVSVSYAYRRSVDGRAGFLGGFVRGVVLVVLPLLSVFVALLLFAVFYSVVVFFIIPFLFMFLLCVFFHRGPLYSLRLWLRFVLWYVFCVLTFGLPVFVGCRRVRALFFVLLFLVPDVAALPVMFDDTLPLISYERLPQPRDSLEVLAERVGDEVVRQTYGVRSGVAGFFDGLRRGRVRGVYDFAPLFVPSSFVDPYEFSKEATLGLFDATLGLPASLVQHYRYWSDVVGGAGPFRARATVSLMFLDTVLFGLPSGVLEASRTYSFTGSYMGALDTFVRVFMPTSIGYDVYRAFSASSARDRGRFLGRAVGKVAGISLTAEFVKRLYRRIVRSFGYGSVEELWSRAGSGVREIDLFVGVRGRYSGMVRVGRSGYGYRFRLFSGAEIIVGRDGVWLSLQPGRRSPTMYRIESVRRVRCGDLDLLEIAYRNKARVSRARFVVDSRGRVLGGVNTNITPPEGVVVGRYRDLEIRIHDFKLKKIDGQYRLVGTADIYYRGVKVASADATTSIKQAHSEKYLVEVSGETLAVTPRGGIQMRYARKREYHSINIYPKGDHVVVTDGERRIIFMLPRSSKGSKLEEFLPIQYIKPRKIDLKALSIGIAQKLVGSKFRRIKVIEYVKLDKVNFAGKLGEEIAIRELFRKNKVHDLIYHENPVYSYQVPSSYIEIRRGGRSGLDIIDTHNRIVYEVKALDLISASKKGIASSIKGQINRALNEANIWLLRDSEFIKKIIREHYKFKIILVLYRKISSSPLVYEYAVVEVNTVFNGYEIYIPETGSSLYKYFYGSLPLYTVALGTSQSSYFKHSKSTTVIIYVGDNNGKPYVIRTDIEESENDD